MSQPLNNPAHSIHRDYGATSSATPEVSFAAGTSSSGNSGFSPTEFVSLSENIGHNITTIHGSSKQLERHLKLIGTSKDISALRDNIHTTNAETNACVQTTSQDLQRLQAVVRHGDRAQKLQLEKLKHEFEEVVKKYSGIQKKILTAIRQSYQLVVEAERQSVINARSELLQQQREEEAELTQALGMLVEQKRRMEEIQADIIDVNKIMNELSVMVNEQGADLDIISGNIEATASYVEEGRTELQKAEASRNSHRRKILILLVIAVIIGLIVTGIVVAKLS